jgi:hypothetical protein
MKLIDADKQKEWIKKELSDIPVHFTTSFDRGRHAALMALLNSTEAGTFDPAPPVQPDIKPGAKLRHKDHPQSIGEAWDYPKVFARFKGQRPAYYHVDGLEVITDGS